MRNQNQQLFSIKTEITFPTNQLDESREWDVVSVASRKGVTIIVTVVLAQVQVKDIPIVRVLLTVRPDVTCCREF